MRFFGASTTTLLLATFASAQPRSQTVCDSNSGLCFEGLHDTATNVTLGFVLPPKNVVQSESFIGMLSFPLPYGFVAFAVGQSAVEPILSIRALSPTVVNGPVALFGFPPKNNQDNTVPSLDLSNMVAPLTTLSKASAPALVPSESAKLTISQKSTVTSNHATALFLCENCSASSTMLSRIFESDSPLLTILSQDDEPLYLGPSLADTVLPLSGVETKQFLLDTKAARTADFEQILHEAGF